MREQRGVWGGSEEARMRVPKLVGRPGLLERRLGKWHRPLLADPLGFLMSTYSQLSLGEVW